MYHYTYKTYTNSGLYYVGRHSTRNLEDVYMGSGKWVKSIKDKSKVKKDILAFYESFDDLKTAEKSLLKEHINNEKCMNFNNEPTGWASGSLNPSHNDDVKRIRSSLYKGKKRKPFSNEWKTNMSKSHIGLKQSRETVSKRDEKNSKQWIITSPNGEIHNVKNLSKFCRENDLDQGNMIRVSQGKYKHNKGWKCSKVIRRNNNE